MLCISEESFIGQTRSKQAEPFSATSPSSFSPLVALTEETSSAVFVCIHGLHKLFRS